MADLLFDRFGFDQTSKAIVHSTKPKHLNTNKRNRWPAVLQWFFPLQSEYSMLHDYRYTIKRIKCNNNCWANVMKNLLVKCPKNNLTNFKMFMLEKRVKWINKCTYIRCKCLLVRERERERERERVGNLLNNLRL